MSLPLGSVALTSSSWLIRSSPLFIMNEYRQPAYKVCETDHESEFEWNSPPTVIVPDEDSNLAYWSSAKLAVVPQTRNLKVTLWVPVVFGSNDP